MPYSSLRPVTLVLLTLIMNHAFAQPNPTSCERLKTGVFYSYPVNANNNYKSERTLDLQTEIDLTTDDTTYYDIKWTSNCEYALKYKAGGKKMGSEALSLLKQYTIVCVVNTVGSGYHVTTSYINASTNYPISIDTLWHSEQKVSADRIVLKGLTPAEQRKVKLKDTSTFALLYVYRPSKFVCSGVSFPLYGNDILMCGFPEKGGAFVFKISKQGLLRLQGQHRQKKDYLDLDIRFGQKYYVRVDTKWSMARCIPFLSEKDKETGEEEFLEAPQY